MAGYIFKVGEIVVHELNPTQQMEIIKIVRQNKMMPTDKMELNPESGKMEFIKELRSFFLGIDCQWFDNEGKKQVARFHSKHLIPRHFAGSPEQISVFLGSKIGQ